MNQWVGINKLPEYNPFMFEVARHVRCLTVSDAAQQTKISAKKIRDIENGNCLPTIAEFEKLSACYDFPKGFFEQWWDTKLDMSGPIAKNVPVDYLRYKVFKELNPAFTRMIAHFPKPTKVNAVLRYIDFA